MLLTINGNKMINFDGYPTGFSIHLKKTIFAVWLVVLANISFAQNNATFSDASLNPKNIAAFGDAIFGGVSGNFDGNGDYLTVSPTPLPGNTSALTMEAWIYMESVSIYGWPIVSQSVDGGQGEQEFFVSGSGNGADTANKLRFYRAASVSGAIDIIGTTVIPTNQWVHVAISFDGATVKLFVNGKLDASVNATTGWVEINQPFYVGRTVVPSYAQYQSYAQGEMSDLRITKNISRYASDFTPSSSQQTLTEDPYKSNVVLLLMSKAYADANDVITFNQTSAIDYNNLAFENKNIIVDGATLTLIGNHKFSSVRLINNSVLTTAIAASDTAVGITITATEIVVDEGSRIDVSAKGLLGDPLVGIYSGGSHAGKGGEFITYLSGITYGAYQQPITFGRGGRDQSIPSTNRGGGAIKLVADTLTLNGMILAKGEAAPTSVNYGGGAGGSIWLDIGAINSSTGKGEVNADGGDGANAGGGGGGGRVALYYQSLTGINETLIHSKGGLRGSANSTHGGAGTVYLNDKTGVTQYPLHIQGLGSDTTYALTPLSGLAGENHIVIEKAAVSLSGLNPSAALEFTDSRVSMTEAVNLTGALSLVNSSFTLATNATFANSQLGIVNSNINVQGNGVFSAPLIIQGGKLAVSGNASFTSMVTGTNAATAFVDIGGILTVPNNDLVVDGITLSLAQNHTFNSIHLKNGGVLTTPVASTTFTQGITLTAATIIIDEGSQIDVSGKGLVGDPLAGVYSGGSHAGKGGEFVTYLSGITYGSYQQPATFGRGGLGASISGTNRGGGAIKLIADTLTLNGMILANGEAAPTSVNYGGGAGGSIWLDIGAIISSTGKGALQANGGSGANAGGGGGGGRVALYCQSLTGVNEASLHSNGGLGGTSSSTHGGAGTVYLNDKTGVKQYPLRIQGLGSDTTYALTPLSGLESENHIVIEKAAVSLTDAVINGRLDLTDSRVIATTTSFTQPVYLQNSHLTFSGNASFASMVTGTNAATAFVDIGGILTVPNNDLVVDGITLSLAQNHTFNSIHLKNGGVLTTPVASTTFTQGITLTATTIIVDEGSRIDVSGKGLQAETNTNYYSGGSHGGKGGVFSPYPLIGAAYGSYQEPIAFGRGGCDGSGSCTTTGSYRGGGAIKLIATTLTLNGLILANGESAPIWLNYGGGAGGSIWLDVGAINSSTGKGELQANAGNGANAGGGGGGGRVALYYQSLTGINEASIHSNGGLGGTNSSTHGGAGTVYIKDKTGVKQYPLRIQGLGSDATYALTPLSGLAGENHIVIEKAAVSLNDTVINGRLDLTDSRVIATTTSFTQPVYLQNSRLTLSGNVSFATMVTGTNAVTAFVDIGGILTVPNNDLVVDGITLSLAQNHTFNSIHLKNGGVLTTPVASTTFTQGITLTAITIIVDEGSRIDVSGKGLQAETNTNYYSGGSHGGEGGVYSPYPLIGATYGSYQEPIAFGRGGCDGSGSCTTSSYRGGGAIKIIANTLTLEGTMLANGDSAPTSVNSGGGAGGSIWLEVGAINSSTGKGELHANGGNAANAGGGGGGGRIALYYQVLSGIPAENLSALGGKKGNTSSTDGGVGSLYQQETEALPYVYASNLTALSNQPVSQITLDFSVPINPSTLTVSDVVIVNKQGANIYPSSITAISDKSFTFHFVTPLGEGKYTVQAGPDITSVKGNNLDQNRNKQIGEGKLDAYVFDFEIDVTAPQTITVNVPVAPYINKITSTFFRLSGTRDANTSLWLNGSMISPLGIGEWNYNLTLAQGNNEWVLLAKDASGNASVTTMLQFDVDSIAPSLASTIPGSGAILATWPATLTLNVNEQGSGFDLSKSSIVIQRDGTVIDGDLSANSNTLNWTPTSPLSDGQYLVSVGLVDLYGNNAASSYSFTLDSIAPQVPALNSYPASVNTSTYTFTGNKEAYSQVLFNDQVIVGGSSATTWSYTATLVDGLNSFSFSLKDLAGNQSSITSATIIYDNIPPGQVAFTADNKGSGMEVTLSWLSYIEMLNGNDIASYRIYSSLSPYTDIQNATLANEVSSAVKLTKLTGLARNTTYYVSVVAVDKTGLLLPQVTPIMITPVDTQAPTGLANLLVSSDFDKLSLSWNPANNTDADLAYYRLSYFDNGEPKTITLNQSVVGNANPVVYQLTGLAPATAYNLRVSAVDESGNTSAGLTDPGVTLLTNPMDVKAEPASNSAELVWSAIQPYALVKQYAVYVQSTPFTSVEGLTPKQYVGKGGFGQTSINAVVSGLSNGTKVYVAVTTVNTSNGELKTVQSVAVTPQDDKEGPTITEVLYVQANTSLNLDNSPTLTTSGKVALKATDKSKVSRVVYALDNEPLSSVLITNAAGAYEQALDLLTLADGAHSLTVDAYDSLENVTHKTYAFTVDLAAPGVPGITIPAANIVTNQVTSMVTGTSPVGTKVELSNNGTALPDVTTDSNGKFSVNVDLQEGTNKLVVKAQYVGRSKWSSDSASRTITLNTQIPNVPTGLTAIGGKQGQVFLSWTAVVSANPNNQVKGYNLYRASVNFTTVGDADVRKVNTQLISGNLFTDMIALDGTYFYAVSAVNQDGNESALSVTSSAVADSQGPKIVQLTYTSDGKKDLATGRMGQGTIQVSATFSEPLRNTPYFALVPDKGVPVTVELSKSFSDEKLYTGQFQIAASTPSGTAYAVMSAYDNAGNRGTDIDQGTTLKIDTHGPEVAALSLTPIEPLKVDEVNGLIVTISIKLNDETNHSDMPKLIPLLDGAVVAGYAQGIALTRDSSSVVGEPLWNGTFNLPNTATKTAKANLSFSYLAEDDLNNSTTKIIGQNQFQVYQGDLPPLAVPSDLTAKAQPGGKVKLSWKTVDKAISYVLYRQGPSDASLIALDPVTALEFIDQTATDGTYLYAIASVRSDNGQESRSAKSNTVSVKTDRIAPSVPKNFTLELNGAGIVSRWLAPVVDNQSNPQSQDGLTYNLYRVARAKDQQVTDIAGITPIQTGIPALIALDTKPSTDEHSYFVTAVDAAGNESAPSTTVYLNFGLLPVSPLSILLNNNSYPSLTWQHDGAAIKSYKVSRHTGDETPVLLTPEAIKHVATTTTYLDNSYNGNQVSRGAGQEVVYSVVTVDSNNVESLAHELKLPALTVKVEKTKEVVIERGIMNQVLFRVDNKGNTEATKLRLYVNLSENGTIRQHVSDTFNVPANGNILVPVVIGGYSKLDGIADLTLRLEQLPQTSESINITELETVLVGSSSLTASLDMQDFIRGGAGKVSFTITNTSEVETELVLATNNGNADSNEVRLVLEDLQGNVLTSQPIKQFTGGVIGVSTGQMVARIAPKASFTSNVFSLNIPAAAPDQVKLRLVVDKYHYHLGQDTHVEMSGVGVGKDVQLSDTPYYAEVNTIEPKVIYAKGETVTITGNVFERSTHLPMANAPITLVYSVRGFELKSTVYSDDLGKFVFAYKSDGTTGKYRVSAVHPDVTDRPNQGEFMVEGGSVSPQELDVKIPRNYVQTIPLRIEVGYESTLNNVRLVQIASGVGETAQMPTGIAISYDPLTVVNASTSAYLNLSFSGDNSAADTGVVSYRVEADNHTGSGALGTINLRYTLMQAAPAVATKPNYIDTGVGLEQQVVENLIVSNKGLDVLRNASVSLTKKDGSALPTWVILNTAAALGDLAIGEERAVQIIASPKSDTAEGDYEFTLKIKGDNLDGYTLPVFIKVTQSGKGKAFFHVSDIYTATLDTNNQRIDGVNSASIQLQNENVLSAVYNLNTDTKGEALFENIPAGRYSYRTSAFDHNSINGRVWIKPGVTTSEEVFVMNNLVNIEWSVREITLEDRYEIKLEATFKTNVPVPLLMLSPLMVQLPVMKQGEVFQGEFKLTNYGLIRALNVKQTLPGNTNLVRFEFLKTVPETLEPGEVFTLPYRIQALNDFNPDSDAQASGGGCGSLNANVSVSSLTPCAEGTLVPSGASGGFNSNWGSCGGGGGGSATYNAPTTTSSAGGGYSYGAAGSPLSGNGQQCEVAPACDDCGSPSGN